MCEGETVQQIEELIKSQILKSHSKIMLCQWNLVVSIKGIASNKEQNNLHETYPMVTKRSLHIRQPFIIDIHIPTRIKNRQCDKMKLNKWPEMHKCKGGEQKKVALHRAGQPEQQST